MLNFHTAADGAGAVRWGVAAPNRDAAQLCPNYPGESGFVERDVSLGHLAGGGI